MQARYRQRYMFIKTVFCRFALDLWQVQSQEKINEEILHPEISSNPCSPYPL